MDKIIIKDLEIFAYHGVLDFEKRNGQPFLVTVELMVDLRDAGLTDDLEATVNYANVCEDIRNVMTDEKYNLIESAAENIASAILLKYNKVKSVTVSIGKPQAPIPMTFDMGVMTPFASTVAILVLEEVQVRLRVAVAGCSVA